MNISYNDSAGSETWFRRGLASITSVGRGKDPSRPRVEANSLREIFTDLMAYVVFFEASCGENPLPLAEVRQKMIALIEIQEKRVNARKISLETYREARFAVLSWIDEIILNSAWADRSRWRHLMLDYYGTVNAGEQFFGHLESLPSESNDVREIYYLCLGLGFQGKHAFGENGIQLKELRRELYRQLCKNNGDIRRDYNRLFPEAYPRIIPRLAAPKVIQPIWYILVVSIPILLFGCYWYILYQQSNRLLAIIRDPVIEAPKENWDSCLAKRLSAKGINAQKNERGALITLQHFPIKSSNLGSVAIRQIEDIAEAVMLCAPAARISVEGYASRELDVLEIYNQKYSQDRADRVKEVFLSRGFKKEKLSARGFGSTKNTQGSDETEPGREKNRRVDIIILASDPSPAKFE